MTSDELEPGNIDMATRPHVLNLDGSISSVRTMGITDDDGAFVNIPTVSDDGRIMSDDEAFGQYERTGRHLGKYRSQAAADRAAQALHESEADKLADPWGRIAHGRSAPRSEIADPWNVGARKPEIADPWSLPGKKPEMDQRAPTWNLSPSQRRRAERELEDRQMLEPFNNGNTPIEVDGYEDNPIANPDMDQGGRNPAGLPDRAPPGVPIDPSWNIGGGGGGAGAGLKGAATSADLAPWQPGSAGGELPNGGQLGPDLGAKVGAGLATGGWGTLAMQAAQMIANRRAEERAKKDVDSDMHAQFAADHSDFPQYGYQRKKKLRAIEDKYGGKGIFGLGLGPL